MNMIKKILATAVLASMPMMASAVTIIQVPSVSLGDSPSVSFSVPTTDDGVIFSFSALDRFQVRDIVVTGNGSNGGADTTSTTFSINGAPAQSFSVINTVGRVSGGIGFGPGGAFNAGDVFTVQFFENAVNPITYGVSFTTAAVPVPAAGLLLLTALGGAAALRRRKKAATA